jgi:hypothetical protein
MKMAQMLTEKRKRTLSVVRSTEIETERRISSKIQNFYLQNYH